MSTKIISNENAVAIIEVTAEQEAWKHAQEKAFKKLKSKLKLKGFRDGNAVPDSMAKSYISVGEIFNEGINNILQSLYEEALEESKLNPVVQPEIDVKKVDENELVINIEFVLEPTIEIGEYKGLNVPQKKVTVSKEEVKAEIDNRLVRSANLVTVEDRPAELGDTVVIDFKGFVDDVAFEGGSGENFNLTLGSGQFIPGFEEQLVGVKAGESKTVNVTFPEQYVAELAGKDARFECVVHEIKKKDVPELTDDWVKGEGIENVNTVAEYEAKVKEELKDGKAHQAEHERIHEIIDKVIEGSKIVIPEKLLAAEADGIKNNTKQQIENNGLTWEQYLQITNSKEEDLDKQFKEQAEHNLKHFVVLKKIAELEKISVTDEEINKELENIGAQYSMTADQVKAALGNNITRIADQLADRKIEKFLDENNK